MMIVAHKSDNNISEKAEVSFEESDPQRLKYLLRKSLNIVPQDICIFVRRKNDE
jgi:hypothetical protein